jgi:malonate-semialdehyde dehydrogenase (acetylating)/methylmalonate-semialdehyde dehydrogenase
VRPSGSGRRPRWCSASRFSFATRCCWRSTSKSSGELVTLENDKDARDAGGEVRRGIEVVEFACGMPTLLMGETVRDVARGIDNASYRYPLVVVVAIAPFNFPCMIPLWTIPAAIGAGNTYILKPS